MPTGPGFTGRRDDGGRDSRGSGGGGGNGGRQARRHGSEKKGRRSKASRRSRSPSTSSSSTGARRARKVTRAARYLEKHSPEYKQWLESSKKDEEDRQLRRQGEALAAAMQTKFEQALQAVVPAPTFPPQPPQPPPRHTTHPPAQPTHAAGATDLETEEERGARSGGSSSHAAHRRIVAKGAGGDRLSATQLKWLSAEFNHKVDFGDGSRGKVVKALTGGMGNRLNVQAIADFFARYGDGVAMPRPKEARAGVLLDIAMGQ